MVWQFCTIHTWQLAQVGQRAYIIYALNQLDKRLRGRNFGRDLSGGLVVAEDFLGVDDKTGGSQVTLHKYYDIQHCC